MWEKLRVIFAIPELRQKILLTLALLGIYRIGYQIRLPFINSNINTGNDPLNTFLDKFGVLAATDLREFTIFGLGIMPYISASIVFQLLGSVWAPIEQLRKEGQTGMRKINEYTRYLTVFLCLIQSWVFLRYVVMASPGQIAPQFCYPGTQTLHFGWQIAAVSIMTCGTIFLMWLGEQIDEYGIGNGISLLIMASILAQMPKALLELKASMTTELSGSSGEIGPDKLIVLGLLFVGVVFGVVFITLGQRRIQTQSAKHVRGRRVYGGTKQYLPLRINQAGVMPIIFASSLLMLPGLLFGVVAGWFSQANEGFGEGTWYAFLGKFFTILDNVFNTGQSLTYIVCYVLLIFFFCYFWTSITFNPKEMSENLKDHGTFIPGYRPGKRTADHLERVMVRITYVGAAFLSLVAIVPIVVNMQLGVPWSVAAFYGGTSLLIAVSVAFDLIQKVDNHLLMRNYRGLLES
ncbi:MAG: preprotein translocase subunit SecY [Planctomycetales bacterium]|nr:preprotein translocase subunit SecY [Planctomycetales bacterium]